MGVRAAVEKASRTLSLSPGVAVCCLHELVHNEQVVAELLKWNRCDENGRPIYNVQTVKSPYRLARCSAEEKNYIYDLII